MKLFRELLERVPEYKAELRQILDLRSLIHDDALRLNPPEYLSNHVRESVGEQFASLPDLAFEEEEEKKRRAIPFTWRIAGSTVAAGLAVLAIALGPLLKAPFDRAPVTLPVATQQVAMADDASVRIERGSAYAIPDVEIAPELLRTASTATTTRSDRENAITSDVAQQSIEATSTPVVETIAAANAISDQDIMDSRALGESNNVPSVVVLPNAETDDIAASLGLFGNEPSEQVAHARQPDVVNALAQEPVPGDEHMLDQPSLAWRTFAVGVTVGTGNVAESESPTALMQNSYYLSFGLSPNNRVGVEMGGAAFMQQKGVATFTNTGNNGFVKPNEGAIPTPAAGQGQLTIVEKQEEEQITYGAIFYDRKLPLNTSWDLCGRVSVGGADNAVLMNLRAYAAYSPSSNVTLTMGLGGSALHQFTVRENGNSLNYGVYYGIETGF